MSTGMTHYATCLVWQTGTMAACTCKHDRPWRIRRTPDGWQTYRWIQPEQYVPTYEPFMSCASHAAAIQLVDAMLWLATGTDASQESWSW